MGMVASVHLADVGVGTALGLIRKAPDPGSVKGLRHANVAVAGALGGSVLPSPTLGRVGLIAFWDDDEAIDRFDADHPLAQRLATGWRVRLEPLRAFGEWPGLPGTVAGGRSVDYDGPAVVLTLGRVRLTRVVPFLRTSAKAEAAVLTAPGVIWATGMARPPFVATCSLWESSGAVMTYAYGRGEPAR